MTQQVQQLSIATGPIRQTPVLGTAPGPQPVFFFDGDFRTLDEMKQRAQLNSVLLSYVVARSQR